MPRFNKQELSLDSESYSFLSDGYNNEKYTKGQKPAKVNLRITYPSQMDPISDREQVYPIFMSEVMYFQIMVTYGTKKEI